MTSTLSVYYSPWHDYPQDADYMRRLDPAWVRIHQPTGKAINLVQDCAPNAKVMLRSWDIDDNNGQRKQEMYADPKGAARNHLEMWKTKLHQLEAELNSNGWAYNKAQWYIGLINEPDPNYNPQTVEYSLEFMSLVKGTPIRLGVAVSSVGNFSKPSENGEGWTKFVPLEKPINDGGHVLLAHEYWQPEGPTYGEDEGNLAWRHHIIPLNVPIVIGESGANGYIYGRHSQTDDAGWQKFMNADQYAAQVKEYIAGCDTRVQGVCLYMLDFHSDQWWSFNTGPASEQLLAIKDTRPQVASPYDKLPPTNPGPTPPGEVEPPTTTPAPATNLVHPLPGAVITAHFSVDNGHEGIDLAMPQGTPIRSVSYGVVAWSAYEENGYGWYVRIDHPELPFFTFYAHMAQPGLGAGSIVEAGQHIGLVGSTGNSTGPHLHFETRYKLPSGAYSPYSPLLNGRCCPESVLCHYGLKL